MIFCGYISLQMLVFYVKIDIGCTYMEELLLKNFIRISNIPRESGNEKNIADFFVNIAKSNNLYYHRDNNNNILIKKNGKLSSPPIGIQAHLDMVCEKKDNSNHDFSKDPIEVVVNEDVVMAKDTSLGADQGVGLAIMLTLIEDNELISPDIEFIFTVEEETTFKGAITFPYKLLTTKRIINLDSCNDEVVYIGAEADIANEYSYSLNYIQNDLPAYLLEMTTLYGGNSGEYINDSKNNAIYKTFEILKNKNIQIISVVGGKNEDDIANKCIIEFSTAENIDDITLNECNCTVTKINKPYSLSIYDTKELINNILLMKSGFVGCNGISANLGYIETTDKEIKFYYLMRSKNDYELNCFNKFINSKIHNLKCEEMYKDKSFIIPKDSKLLKKYKELYKTLFNKEVKEEICTGGIECTVIFNKIKDLDIISIGSNINYFHTTNEETYISSWIKTYEILLKMLIND